MMKATVLMTMMLGALCAKMASADEDPALTCKDDGFKRELVVRRDSGHLIVTFKNVKTELLLANVARPGLLNDMPYYLAQYDQTKKDLVSGLVEQNLRAANNARVDKDDTLTLTFDDSQCTYSSTDTRVVSCLATSGVQFTTETHKRSDAVSANFDFQQLQTQIAAVRIGIPYPNGSSEADLELQEFWIDSTGADGLATNGQCFPTAPIVKPLRPGEG